MRYIFTILIFLNHTKLSLAQENNYKLKNPTNNCIGLYTGFSVFDNLNKYDNYYVMPSGSYYDPLISFKHKKHEFIGGPTLLTTSINFIAGRTASYLYHFNKKKVHLFFEGNIRNSWYTVYALTATVVSYNKSIPDGSGGSFGNAKIMILTVHTAIGLEFKIFNFLYGQLAVGPGLYFMQPKPGRQGYDPNDPYNINSSPSFYKNYYGPDWYFRLGLDWRIYNF